MIDRLIVDIARREEQLIIDRLIQHINSNEHTVYQLAREGRITLARLPDGTEIYRLDNKELFRVTGMEFTYTDGTFKSTRRILDSNLY